jgi:hypothetical protein
MKLREPTQLKRVLVVLVVVVSLSEAVVLAVLEVGMLA